MLHSMTSAVEEYNHRGIVTGLRVVVVGWEFNKSVHMNVNDRERDSETEMHTNNIHTRKQLSIISSNKWDRF